MPLSEAKYPFSFGNPLWPGLAKLNEECGELVQILSKIMAYPEEPHPDGKNSRARLIEEMADVQAALAVFGRLNLTEDEVDELFARAERKADLFVGWHKGEEVYV